MNESNEHIVYSQEVIGFVTVANEFCAFLENASRFTRQDFFDKTHKVLPLLYTRFLLLPGFENIFEEGNERFVTEEDWIALRNDIQLKVGPFDEYPEVYDENLIENDNYVTLSISETLADIYQDVKDFLMLYRVGNEDIMNDAIWECQQNFRQYWGQKLVNVLRALHNVYYGDNDLSEKEDEDIQRSSDDEDVDTSNWLINKRFEDFRDGMEE